MNRCETCGGSLLYFGDHDGGSAIACLLCGRPDPDRVEEPLPLRNGVVSVSQHAAEIPPSVPFVARSRPL